MFLVDVFVYKIIKIIKIISFTTGAHQRADLAAQGGDFLLQGRVFLAGKSFFGREEYFWQGRVFFAGKRRSEKGIFQFESQGDYPACHVLHVGSLHIKVGID